MSDETRGKMSVSRKRFWAEASPEVRESLMDQIRQAAPPWTSDRRTRQSEWAYRRIAEGMLGPTTMRSSFTKPELAMALLLEDAGIEYDPQHRIGIRVADFWLPATNEVIDRKSTRLNSSHLGISYAVFCLQKK